MSPKKKNFKLLVGSFIIENQDFIFNTPQENYQNSSKCYSN